ncbi:MAG: tetratricopeptide repeat protein [Gemmatimonadota bacterium]|nr:tetratricopeptide repeat protein [Gemmatimonadota bacterium]MDH3424180.1 tetratricopeptide repeat protein [Gemmatimonadota bacterium]
MKGFSTREVAEVLGIPNSTILSWTRSGLLTPERGPKGAYLFSFQDIVLLRAAKELLDSAVPARRVRSALEALREQLPVGRPLSAVHISALGDRVLVRDEGSVWEADSGQLTMDFAVAEVARRAEPLVRRAMAVQSEGVAMSADDWYDTALDLEAVAPDRAIDAYKEALTREPDHGDANVNLGRLLHEQGDLAGAEQHYRTASAADLEGGRARYNLGVVLEDQGRSEEAVEAYENALAVDEDLAAAHFNLSRLYEALGEQTKALNHLAAYKRALEHMDLEP